METRNGEEEERIYPRVVVLTGGIGAGKSSCARLFAEAGAELVSADQLARDVVAVGSPAIGQIRTVFGPTVINESGEINRQALGELVFGNDERREQLEAIVHPAIRLKALRSFEEILRRDPSALVVYECPLFFEAGLDRFHWRAVVAVVADEAVCINRVLQRDGLSPEQVVKRMTAQLPMAEKSMRADYVITNNSTVEALAQQVERVLGQIRAARP